MKITLDLPDDELARVLRRIMDQSAREIAEIAEPPGDRVLTRGEAAEILGVSLRSFDRLVASGRVPRYEPPFGRVGYLESVVMALRDNCVRDPLRLVPARKARGR